MNGKKKRLPATRSSHYSMFSTPCCGGLGSDTRPVGSKGAVYPFIIE
ncbi:MULTISPECIES: hypothetical protein [Psychrobacter]|uniref:Uncharacterized protein n=1 Tax=Psychrobacter communis TaxID=2762238 RepID=A0ABR8RL39_9GAMM|nr:MULTISPECIES: hypothetical protein [Psychrobacter]MBD7948451.1 hypothetical protein [Psychrobacter communis]MCG3861244.1 hypothetical protein [Psychrobacter sp. Ps5]